ncbi:nucleobindin-2 [Centruroides vittatus]|uniref:nucleobindin-2 n=1 Tax=Centruroides vittatus TaxID=120091 RepID=UPI00350F9299
MNRSQFVFLLIFALLAIHLVGAPPVDPKKKKEKEKEHEEDEGNDLDDYGLEYGRYLQQVVQALEEDKDFAKKLENISTDQIKSGDVAKELEFVKHNVRTKLDELKRIELERLRKLSREEMERLELGLYRNEDGHLAPPSIDGRRWRTISSVGDGEGINRKHIKVPHHLDVDNKHTFEIEDLRKLMKAATRDLEELDRRRREEFKQYELEKEYQFRESLKNMSESEKAEQMKKHEEMLKKHKDHPKVHHPGSKQQLEQVWEEQDHMQGNEFDPRVFFAMHDVNGDGYLDEQEVEAILSLEIKKMYDPQNNVEDDPQEMMEEYNRMREHVYKETDKNKDGLISKEEFMDMTKRADFEKDDGWRGLDEQQIYTEEELKAYEKKRIEELQKLNAYYGYQNAHGGAPVPHGMPQYQGIPPPHPGYQPHPQQMPQGYQPHPQQMPQGAQQQGYQSHHQQAQMGGAHPQGYQSQQQGEAHHQPSQQQQGYQPQMQQMPQPGAHQIPQPGYPPHQQQMPQGIHQPMPGMQQQPHPGAQYGIPNNQNPQMRHPSAQGIHPGVQIVQGNAHGLPTHAPSDPPPRQPQPTQYNPQQRQPAVEQKQAEGTNTNAANQKQGN